MRSRKMLILIGLATYVLVAPTGNASKIVADYEKVNQTPTITKEEFVSTIAEMHIEEQKEEKKYIGKFTITHYCSCELCNGKWAGMPAANGEELKENYTIAVDPKVIPLNSWVEINNKKYRACDTGSAIKGNKIDIFIDDHDRCYELGKIKDVEVYLIKDGD